ncbi:unnamed protein product, partial [Gulo gulo]
AIAWLQTVSVFALSSASQPSGTAAAVPTLGPPALAFKPSSSASRSILTPPHRTALSAQRSLLLPRRDPKSAKRLSANRFALLLRHLTFPPGARL